MSIQSLKLTVQPSQIRLKAKGGTKTSDDPINSSNRDTGPAIVRSPTEVSRGQAGPGETSNDGPSITAEEILSHLKDYICYNASLKDPSTHALTLQRFLQVDHTPSPIMLLVINF